MTWPRGALLPHYFAHLLDRALRSFPTVWVSTTHGEKALPGKPVLPAKALGKGGLTTDSLFGSTCPDPGEHHTLQFQCGRARSWFSTHPQLGGWCWCWGSTTGLWQQNKGELICQLVPGRSRQSQSHCPARTVLEESRVSHPLPSGSR